jgi:hypothetical protein
MKTISTTSRRLPGSSLLAAGTLCLLAFSGLSAPTARADIGLSIRVDAAPPPPRHEVVIERERPGPEFVWVGGYWDGSPGHYVWRSGHWDRPPHGHARWVEPRWERDHDGHYHQVRGEWR